MAPLIMTAVPGEHGLAELEPIPNCCIPCPRIGPQMNPSVLNSAMPAGFKVMGQGLTHSMSALTGHKALMILGALGYGGASRSAWTPITIIPFCFALSHHPLRSEPVYGCRTRAHAGHLLGRAFWLPLRAVAPQP